jgi:glycosyltransferase involved in cell wall biosynthesis
MKIKIIVPCYNESLRIKPQEYIDFIQTTPNIDFLFVNDGSQDNTLQILKSLQGPRFEIINSSKNQGKAESIRQGFKSVDQKKYQFTGYIDADHSLPLSNLKKMFDFLKENPSTTYLSGLRTNLEKNYKESSLFRLILKKVFTFTVNKLFKLKIKDPQSACKMIATEHIEDINKKKFSTRWLVDLEIYFRIFRSATITEIEVNDWKYQHGSKIKKHELLIIPFQLFYLFLTSRF